MKTKHILLLTAISFSVNFCTVTFNPDGSRTYGVDAQQVIEVLDHK